MHIAPARRHETAQWLPLWGNDPSAAVCTGNRGCSRLYCTRGAIAAAVQSDEGAQMDRLGLKFGETALGGPTDVVGNHVGRRSYFRRLRNSVTRRRRDFT